MNDAATYQEPHQLAEGFDDILVNGELVRDATTSSRDAAGPRAALEATLVTIARSIGRSPITRSSIDHDSSRAYSLPVISRTLR